MSGGTVYRVYDIVDVLLYVGCSVNVEARMAQHADTAPWFPFMDRIERTDYATVAEAQDAEAAAIYTEHPRWNVRGRSPAHPDGPLTSRFSAPHLKSDVSIWREHQKVRKLESEVAAKRAELREASDHLALLLAGRAVLATERATSP